MDRMTGADSWYLYAETERVHTHVTGAVVLDPSTSPERFDLARLRAHVEAVVPPLADFRQRLVEVPFGVDHPVWVEDPDFELDSHVAEHRLGGAGGDEELAEFIGAFSSTQLPRDAPLWQIVLVEGLAEGRFALVAKMHHAIMNGSTGVDLMQYLLSLSPDEDPAPVQLDEAGDPPAPVPGRTRVLLDAGISRISNPGRALRAGWRAGSGVVRGARTTLARRGEGATMAGPFAAPRAPWNGALTQQRVVAFATVDLEQAKATKSALGITVNDVVLTACTLGLRRCMATQGARVDQPLVAAVPVDVRGDSGGGSTNQVSNMFVHLPVQISDPLEIAAEVHAVAAEAKTVQAELGGDLLGDVAELLPPPLFHAGAELWSRTHMADVLPPIQNLIVSNVPGSPLPLYMAGAEVVGLFPFGPLIEGSGLNVTVLSHIDTLQVGVIACPDLVGDVWGVTEAIVEGFAELHRAAGLTISPRNEN